MYPFEWLLYSELLPKEEHRVRNVVDVEKKELKYLFEHDRNLFENSETRPEKDVREDGHVCIKLREPEARRVKSALVFEN